MAGVVQKSDYLIKLDNIIGLRAWGLILYGALPSNLALLGALEVKIDQINDLSLFYFIMASILPILVIFMLIKDRHREWYLTTDLLNLRSAITTIIILILATSISGISGIIHNRYIVGIPHSWNWNEWIAIAESFLLAIVSLVISTTFFIAALSKEVDLPGLPSKAFTELMTKLHIDMRKMKRSKIWGEYIPLDDELINLIETIKQDLDKVNSIGNYLAKESLKQTCYDIINLINVLNTIKYSINENSAQYNWKIYFADDQLLSNEEKKYRYSNSNQEKFKSIENLRNLNFGS